MTEDVQNTLTEDEDTESGTLARMKAKLKSAHSMIGYHQAEITKSQMRVAEYQRDIADYERIIAALTSGRPNPAVEPAKMLASQLSQAA